MPEHVLLSPQSPEAPASAKWKEDDRIEALCRKDDMTRYYPGTVHEVNVDGTYAVIFDGENTVTTPPRTSTMLMFWKITSASWPMHRRRLRPHQ